MFQTSHSQQHVDYFTQAFALQYISLILFILIFSIGAFLQPDDIKIETLKAIIVPENIKPAAQIPEAVEIARFPVSDLFVTSQATLNEDGWNGIKSVLTSHDINFSLQIYWGNRIGLETALTRAENVISSLRAVKVPESALTVAVARSDLSDEGEIVLTRGVGK